MKFRHKYPTLVELIPPSLEVEMETLNRDYIRDIRNMDRFNRIVATAGSVLALAGLGAVIEQGVTQEHKSRSSITPATISASSAPHH